MARPLSTVAGGLGIVLGILCLITWLSRQFAPPGKALLPKEAVELLGRAPLTGKQQLRLLRVGGKLLLIAISPAGAETLTEITDAAEVEQLLALCRRGRPDSSSADFREVISQLAREPATGGFAGVNRATPRGAR